MWLIVSNSHTRRNRKFQVVSDSWFLRWYDVFNLRKMCENKRPVNRGNQVKIAISAYKSLICPPLFSTVLPLSQISYFLMRNFWLWHFSSGTGKIQKSCISPFSKMSTLFSQNCYSSLLQQKIPMVLSVTCDLQNCTI